MASPQYIDRSTDQRHFSSSNAQAASRGSEEEEIWHVLLGPGNVQQLTLERLDSYYDAGVISDDTFVWQKGMKEWKKLAAVLAELPEPVAEEGDDPFHVLLEDGTVKVLTIEQIDDFYRLGLIDDDTCL